MGNAIGFLRDEECDRAFWGMGNASAFLGDGECERFFEGWGMRFSNYLEMRSRSVPEAYQAFYFAF